MTEGGPGDPARLQRLRIAFPELDRLGRARAGNDAHRTAATDSAEPDGPADQREQCVVTTTADAVTGVKVGPALADDDLAGVDRLATEPLDAESLRVGVAAVTAGRRALLVCHFRYAFSIPVTRTCVYFCRWP